MIYERVAAAAPIRQGDIFVNVPRVDLSMTQLLRAEDDGSVSPGSWPDLYQPINPSDSISLIVDARPTIGIVITQDCDALRSADVSLCEVRPFHSVEGADRASPDSSKKWIRLITQQARKNLKWFYLPPDPDFLIGERMAADFRVVMRFGLDDLLNQAPERRVGRINAVATEHFRERLSEFFRRYAYDEWYPLNREELADYQAKMPEPVEPFPWQHERDS